MFCLMILFIAGVVFCDETALGADPQPTHPLAFIPIWIYPALSILAGSLVYLFKIRPRRKRKTMYRKLILTEVNLIAKSYREKIVQGEIDIEVRKLMSGTKKPSTISPDIACPVLQNDLDILHNLRELCKEAASLLSQTENQLVQNLLAAFMQGIYPKKDADSGKCINLDRIYKISDIGFQLRTLLTAHIQIKNTNKKVIRYVLKQ